MYHALLVVRAVAIKAGLVVMDQYPAKGFHGRTLNPGMPFVFPRKIHGRHAVAAYDHVVVGAIDPCHCAVHMHDGRVQE